MKHNALLLKNDEFCIENDGFCIKNAECQVATPWKLQADEDEEGKEGEAWQDPSAEERNADGDWLIGRRVRIAEYGPGTVVSFNKKLGWYTNLH